jgi:hypothetical protein
MENRPTRVYHIAWRHISQNNILSCYSSVEMSSALTSLAGAFVWISKYELWYKFYENEDY